ncbi:MAG TPA: adenylate/guanylate cyclase domain-containing protein, partial [Solirubrobacteraceae bacterium]|nr:adenylate/guanylate cyclase domain-containing protein [Solirubrobacteraceae bacterium]
MADDPAIDGGDERSELAVDAAALRAHAALDGTVSLLFTDIEGSSALIERLGDRRWSQALAAHDRLVRDAVDTYGGLIVKAAGDGFMVAFSSARHALSCAIAIQRALADERADQQSPVAVRMGVHTGEAVHRDGDIFGKHVVIAARIAAHASGGEILASALVHELAASDGDFAFDSGRSVSLKGLSGDHKIYAVRWQRAPGGAAVVDSGRDAVSAPEPFVAALPPLLLRSERRPLIGREAELERLNAFWAEVRDGARRFVVLAGEPGIGKTRLTAEFCRGVHSEGATVLFGRCDQQTLLPYQSLVEALWTYVRDCPRDSLAAQLGRSGGELVRLLPQLPTVVPSLDPPLSDDSEGERYRLFEAVSTFLANASQASPTVLVVDDLHWADTP